MEVCENSKWRWKWLLEISCSLQISLPRYHWMVLILSSRCQYRLVLVSGKVPWETGKKNHYKIYIYISEWQLDMLWNEVRCDELRWGEERWNEVRCEVRWGEVRWGEVRWGEMRWGEVRWGEMRWGEVRSQNTNLQFIIRIASHLVSSEMFPLLW